MVFTMFSAFLSVCFFCLKTIVLPSNPSAISNQQKYPLFFTSLLLLVGLVSSVGLVLKRTNHETLRAEYLNQLPEWSSDTPIADAASITGYESGQRVAIVPGHDKRSFEVIANTQQMLAENKFRVDRINSANTPLGHPGHLASLTPWTLAVATKVQQLLSGRSNGSTVETAALRFNPHLLLLALVTATILTACTLGRLPAALLAFGMAAMFPFAAVFVPGAPHPLSLHALCLLFGLLTLLAGADAARRLSTAGRFYFAASGIFGALALWLDVPAALPFLGGLLAAGLVITLGPRSPLVANLPWRIWGLAGAGTVLLGYFIDFFPCRGEEVFRYLHPLYALAWLGAGEILQLTSATGRQRAQWNRRQLITVSVAAIALLQLPLFLFSTHTSLYVVDGPDAFKLSPASSIAAPSLSAWLAQDGFSPSAWATLLPILLIPLALFFLYRADVARRITLVLMLGPVLPCLWIGASQLSYGSHLDVALLALTVALATLPHPQANWSAALVITGTFFLCLVPGLYLEFKTQPTSESLSSPEFESYIERDLAHWLRQHSSVTPAVLAPPRVTSALCYHGGFTGLGTFDRDNQAGTAAAIRIVCASSNEEAYTLIEARKLTHIVIPFWDNYLNDYLRLGLGADADSDRRARTFLATLQQWQVPGWLRPLPYRLPPGPGVDGQVVIFEVVEEQPPAVAAARMADYFLEMDLSEQARSQTQELAKYPNDWGALAALCMVSASLNDSAGLDVARGKLISAVEKPERRKLVWDRRVSLAIVLAQQKRPDLAKIQIEKCLAEIDADKLRSLTTVSLYRFNLICKRYGTEITDPALRTLSRSLLRPDLRPNL